MKFKQAENYLSIIQSFLDLFQVTGAAGKDGVYTDDEVMRIGRAFIVVAQTTHLDKTIATEIPGVSQSDINNAVTVATIGAKIASEQIVNQVQLEKP
jgi:hypothetical protein